jgi:hypothetical protein
LVRASLRSPVNPSSASTSDDWQVGDEQFRTWLADGEHRGLEEAIQLAAARLGPSGRRTPILS